MKKSPSLRSFIAYRLGAASLAYYIKSKNLKRRLALRTGNAIDKIGDCIIYANDDACQNGGLCDCLHGMVSAYYIAKQYDNPFKICFTAPFHLDEYLLPNLFDWRIESDEIDYQSCIVRNVPMMLSRFHATWAEERAFHYRYLCQIARYKGTKLLYSNAHLVGEVEFCHLFSELFKPSSKLQEQIDSHLAIIGNPYIGASFRFRNLLGDFFEPGSSPLNPDEQAELIQRSTSQIETLHQSYPKHRIFVASDSVRFCSSLQSLPYVYCIQGSRGHIAYQAADSIMSSFVDLFLLSKSEVNNLFITDKLYHSGFAMTASFVGNVPYRELYF